MNALPQLRRRDGATELVVQGEPYLILGGELGNSSASDLAELERIWPRLVELGLNTLLAPVYWELMEPEEGRFDFTLVDGLIQGARAHGQRLVLLWFGSWKNSMSCYAPLWVKADSERFPRARLKDGTSLEILSAFSGENCSVDARAFAALLRHLREVDAADQTVIMVQVENEVGMLGAARDHGPLAERAYTEPVPAPLEPGRPGSWEELYGGDLAADERFMAWHYARYVDTVARAGKREYPLPMFVNAALNRPEHAPGVYPSAGPLPHLFDVWRAGAPHIDFLAPDIYIPEFSEWCRRYARSDNPLFIPETGRTDSSAVDVFYAVGEFGALGFSPFAIENTPGDAPLGRSYRILRELWPLLLEHRGTGRTAGLLLSQDEPRRQIELGGYELGVRHDYTWEWSGAPNDGRQWPRAGGLIIASGPGEFIAAGSGLIVTFRAIGGAAQVGLASVDEGRFEQGRWTPGRRLNGDETHQGRHLRLPLGELGIQRVRLYTFE